MNAKPILLILSSLLLCACSSGGVSSSDASLSSDPASTVSVTETTTEESKASTEDASTTSEETEQSPEEEVGESWTLDYNAIPATTQNKYNIDFDFAVKGDLGGDVTFHGSYLQRGAGSKNGVSIDGTIQMKKEESYFYMTGGVANKVSFSVLRITSYYEGAEHDFTGTPTVYAIKDDQKALINMVEKRSEDDKRNEYSFEMPEGYSWFRFENQSKYALYVTSLSSVA